MIALSKNHKIIEALIFGSTEPVSEEDMIEKVSNNSSLQNILSDLKNYYSQHGINLVKTGNTWSFRTSKDLYDELIILKKQKRKMSRAAIEVLSIIAYHQPITRAEIENIRGVQMGRGSIDILVEIGWIKPKGRRNTPGRPVTWVTTQKFLEHFSLDNIKSLPGIDELKANGFLDKRSSIATISDIAKQDIDENISENDEEEETLSDFIPSRNQ